MSEQIKLIEGLLSLNKRMYEHFVKTDLEFAKELIAYEEKYEELKKGITDEAKEEAQPVIDDDQTKEVKAKISDRFSDASQKVDKAKDDKPPF